MTIWLVTGATGFIGRYVVRRLVNEKDARVRVLVRRPEMLDQDTRATIEVIRGDIRDARALGRAVQGADTVLHLAAFAQAWSRDPSAFVETNVNAVQRLLELATAYNVRKLVHVSTILTLPPFRAAGVNGRAARPTDYESTKLAGERLVEAYAGTGRDAVIVHPTRVYGPGPLSDANAVTRAVALYLRGLLRVRLADRDALANYAYVDDVAAGIVLAARQGRAGAHYILGGEDASFRQFLYLVSEIAGRSRHVTALPPRLGLILATGAEWWGRLGGRPGLTPGWVRVFLEDRRADLTAARQDLGYGPRGLRPGLTETIHWLRTMAMVPV